MSNFREMAPERLFEKMSNFLLKYEHLYTALKHVIWRFRICNYFGEIFKFRDFMNSLRNSVKFFFSHILEGLKFREKKLYCGVISTSRALKRCIMCSYFKV